MSRTFHLGTIWVWWKQEQTIINLTLKWKLHSFICTNYKNIFIKYLSAQYARRNYIKLTVIRIYFTIGSKLIGQFIVFRLVQVAGDPENTAIRTQISWKLSQKNTCVLGCRVSGLYLQNIASDRDYRACVMLAYCNCTLGKNVGSYIICANPPRRWTRPSPQQICQWVKSVPVPPDTNRWGWKCPPSAI